MTNARDHRQEAWGCPAPEEILQTLAGEATHPHAAHLESCPRCRALARSGAKFMGEGESAQDPRRRMEDAAAAARLEVFVSGLGSRPARRKGLPTWLLPVVAVLLVAVGVWTMGPDTLHRRGAGDVFDGVEGPALRGGDGGGAEWSAPRTRWSDEGLIVRWSAYQDARSYSVTILATDLTPLLTLAARGTELVVPRADLGGRDSGFVRIGTLDPQGREAESPLAAWTGAAGP